MFPRWYPLLNSIVARRPIAPRATRDERGLVDVAAQHHLGLVAVEQLGQLGVAEELGAGPGQRALRRPVVHPEPGAVPAFRGRVE